MKIIKALVLGSLTTLMISCGAAEEPELVDPSNLVGTSEMALITECPSETFTAVSPWDAISSFDQWCQDNCSGDFGTVYCPEAYCQCDGGGDTNSGMCWQAAPAYSGVPGFDNWCQANCSNDPASCPAGFCVNNGC